VRAPAAYLQVERTNPHALGATDPQSADHSGFARDKWIRVKNFHAPKEFVPAHFSRRVSARDSVTYASYTSRACPQDGNERKAHLLEIILKIHSVYNR
jgi:hypothetical protein